MIVDDKIRKCVVFIGLRMANGDFRLAGSGFFIGRGIENGKANTVYLVTAKHVVEGITKKGLTEVYIRGNLTTGSTEWAKTESKDWRFHPTDASVDIALIQVGVPSHWDHLVMPITMCATPDTLQSNEVGLGDEVFIVGLFRHHHGSNKNIPIVRVGNLAALSEEKIDTNLYGSMDAFLIEARSIGGLSGSPVLLNLGVTRYIKGAVQQSTSGPIFLLLGLIHGHFDVLSTSVDDTTEDSGAATMHDRVNTGIAIVVPIEKVVESISTYSPLNG